MDDLGVILGLGIPIAWHLAAGQRVNRLRDVAIRAINFLFLPAAMLAIALSGTRGALIATTPAFLYILATLARFRLAARCAVLGAVVASATVVWAAVPSSSLGRLSTIGAELAEGDLNGRLTLWHEGLEVFAQRPLQGVGCNAYRTAIESGQAAHNSFLSVMVELGMIGLALFLAVLAVAVLSSARSLPDAAVTRSSTPAAR